MTRDDMVMMKLRVMRVIMKSDASSYDDVESDDFKVIAPISID